LRKFETEIDSAVSLFGEIFSVRRGILLIDQRNLTEDFDSSVYIRKKGYKLIFDPKAAAYEYLPYTEKDIVLQRKRVITGTIQTLLKYKAMLFNPRYGFYGLLILPGHKLAQILSPFLLMGFLALSLIFWKMSLLIIFCALVFLKATLILIRKRISLLGLVKYFTLINICCLLAWKDYLQGNYTVKWEKIQGSRA
jgi:biofilm PGA synthesis N-glycosyltransferase PgaC